MLRLAVLAELRANPVVTDGFARLLARGKPAKVALVRQHGCSARPRRCQSVALTPVKHEEGQCRLERCFL